MNSIAWWIMRELGGGIYDGFGSLNVGNLKAGFDLLDVPKQDRLWIFRRISAIHGIRHVKRDQDNHIGRGPGKPGR